MREKKKGFCGNEGFFLFFRLKLCGFAFILELKGSMVILNFVFSFGFRISFYFVESLDLESVV